MGHKFERICKVIKKTIYILAPSALSMSNQDLLRLVTYCGLYCGLCAQRSRISQQARQLQQTLHEEGFDDFFQYVPEMREIFPTFWEFLQKLATFDCACRTGKGGPPDCKIRSCAKQRNIMVCPQCKEYPRQHIQALAEHYPTLIQDGKRVQKLGIKKWIVEQEKRAKRGFAYADIRYPSQT
jgi:hypothetical protein